ncbi:MAG: HAD family hydrolase [Clostridia bacterium]|nr:HAD family hydrolase [Clostridia bacterium]
MKYTHLLWDFNGTLYADMQAGIDSVNLMLAERGLPIIESLERYREIFDFPIKTYYQGLGFDFEKEPYEVLAPLWVELYNEHSKSSTLSCGVVDALEKVSTLGVHQIILSASEKNMLIGQLKMLEVYDYFEDVIGLDNIHAESKLHLAKQWRENHPSASVLYVGDTVHDADTARILGADCLLYTGGHQSREKLAKCGYPLIDSIVEILEYL